MKRILLLCFVACGLLLSSCNNTTSSNKSSKSETVADNELVEYYPPELIEWAQQYHLKIDTTKTYDMDIQIFQSLGDYEGLGNEKSSFLYNGQLLYYVSNDMVYDEKVIKEKAYMMGTYHYTSKDSTYRVVPFYCSVDAYNENRDKFDLILELQDY